MSATPRTRRPARRWAGALVLAALLSVLAAAPALAAVGRVQYAALGDSIAVGYGATNYYGYVPRFRDFLATVTRSVELTNRAVPGSNSSSLRLQLAVDDSTRDAVRRAEIVTVSIGGNNLLPCASDNYTTLNTTCADVGVAVFQQDWPQILSEIRSSIGFRGKLYVLNLYNPFRGDDPNYALADHYVKAVDAVIQNSSYTTAYNYQVADAYGAFQGQTNGVWNVCVYTHFCETNRDPHPTDAGHAKIAQLHKALYQAK